MEQAFLMSKELIDEYMDARNAGYTAKEALRLAKKFLASLKPFYIKGEFGELIRG
jgi:hypothetical protein